MKKIIIVIALLFSLLSTLSSSVVFRCFDLSSAMKSLMEELFGPLGLDVNTSEKSTAIDSEVAVIIFYLQLLTSTRPTSSSSSSSRILNVFWRVIAMLWAVYVYVCMYVCMCVSQTQKFSTIIFSKHHNISYHNLD